MTIAVGTIVGPPAVRASVNLVKAAVADLCPRLPRFGDRDDLR